MRSPSLMFIVVGVSSASVAIVVACTSASTVGENPSIVADAKADDSDAPADPAGDAHGVTPPLDAATDGACRRTGGSGSSGSNGSCDYTEEWTCNDETIALRCRCPEGTCACRSDSFAHDCSGSSRCFMTADERTRCLAPRKPSSSSSGAGTSSSGGSSGSDASSRD